MPSRGAFAVPFARPLIPPPEAWLPLLAPAYAARWFANGGPVSERLEAEIAARCGRDGREAVLVASATAGLTAALLAAGVSGPVAMPAFTFPATAHAALMAGCRPVLCDVDPQTWELSPAAAERAVREHGCRAIMHVRPFGFCRDTSGLEAVADRAGVPLIVDAAAAFGGTHADGTPPGATGTAEVFSFHATKVMAVGEGGVVLAEPELAARIRSTINFSLDGIDVSAPGLNGKLGELPAAVGLAALASLDAHVGVRRRAVERLARAATAGGAVTLPAVPGRPAWQGLPVLVRDRGTRDAALASLRAASVDARRYYSPGLHRTTAFAGYAPDPLPVTDALVERILCLPVHSDLEGEPLEALAAAVETALPRCAAPARVAA